MLWQVTSTLNIVIIIEQFILELEKNYGEIFKNCGQQPLWMMKAYVQVESAMKEGMSNCQMWWTAEHFDDEQTDLSYTDVIMEWILTSWRHYCHGQQNHIKMLISNFFKHEII